MAASPVLADSSFYITLLRQQQDPLQALAIAAATRDVAICGVVRCEVGRAIRNERALAKLKAVWDVMQNVPTDQRLWDETLRTLWELDRRGVTISLTDAVIACCAKRIGAVVLTFDQDFHRIPGVRATDRIDI